MMRTQILFTNCCVARLNLPPIQLGFNLACIFSYQTLQTHSLKFRPEQDDRLKLTKDCIGFIDQLLSSINIIYCLSI